MFDVRLRNGIKQIRFIKLAQQLGFSLKEIAELLTLRVDGQTSCGQVKKRAAAKLVEVEQKMVELQRMRQALSRDHGYVRMRKGMEAHESLFL